MRPTTEVQSRIATLEGPPRALIVGAGMMGRWHLASARRAGVQIVAVVDPDIAAARALAKSAAGARIFADLGLVPADMHFDAAHVCTPMDSHAALVTTLLERGAHVFIEKPLAPSAGIVRVLIQQADQRDLYICPVHQYAFQPGVDRAAAEVAVAGGARRIDFTICSAGAVGSFEGRPDAVAAEILPHPLSILQRLSPDRDIDAVDWTVKRAQPGEFTIIGQMGTTLVTLAISLGARPTGFHTRVHTSRSQIDIDGFHGYGVVLSGRVSRPAKVLAPFERGLKGLAGAGTALASRGLRRDLAYPGLGALTRRFYDALTDPARRPVSMDESLACALAGDRILGGMQRAGAEAVHV